MLGSRLFSHHQLRRSLLQEVMSSKLTTRYHIQVPVVSSPKHTPRICCSEYCNKDIPPKNHTKNQSCCFSDICSSHIAITSGVNENVVIVTPMKLSAGRAADITRTTPPRSKPATDTMHSIFAIVIFEIGSIRNPHETQSRSFSSPALASAWSCTRSLRSACGQRCRGTVWFCSGI